MGFFSDIIRDAQRPSTAALRTGIETGADGLQEPSLDEAVNLVTEAVPPPQRFEEVAARSRLEEGHGLRSPYGILQQAEPRPMPGLEAGLGGGERGAVAPNHAAVAGPDALAPVEPLATVAGKIGPPPIENRHLRAHAEDEPSGLPLRVLEEPSATARLPPVRGATALSQLAVPAKDGGDGQEKLGALMSPVAEKSVAKIVSPQGEAAWTGTALEAEAECAPVRRAAGGVELLPGAVENKTLAMQQERAIAESVESRPVASAPAAVNYPPVQRHDQGHAAASNATPEVHIGHIDIVVLAPEQARPQQPPLSASADLASRHYLRRL